MQGIRSPLSLGTLSFPYSEWTLWKQHQWMVLHRTFVAHLRRSPTAIHVLATMEWAIVPDEAYFCDVGLNSVVFQQQHQQHQQHHHRIVPESKRFLKFEPLAIHPRPLHLRDLPLLAKAVLRPPHHGDGNRDDNDGADNDDDQSGGSGSMYFARKIDLSQEGKLLRMVDRLRDFDREHYVFR